MGIYAYLFQVPTSPCPRSAFFFWFGYKENCRWPRSDTTARRLLPWLLRGGPWERHQGSLVMRVLGTWHLPNLVSSRCIPAEQTWPAPHRAHCHICELHPHVGPTSPLAMGKGLPAGMKRCRKRVWSYLRWQNLRARNDSSFRSGWVNSCVSPRTPSCCHAAAQWVASLHMLPNCHIFFLNKTL